jgi:hypothetical protein
MRTIDRALGLVVFLPALHAACSASTGAEPRESAGGATGNGGAGPSASGGATSSSSGGIVSSGDATGSGGVLIVVPGGGGAAGDGPPSLADGGIDALKHAACATNTARTESAPSVLELVVDTSGSMRQTAPGTNMSKWDVTREALRAAINALPPSTGIGVMYFPEKSAPASTPNGDETDPARPVSECIDLRNQVPIDVVGPAGSMHRTQVLTSLDAPGRPTGGTPTHDAYKIGIDAISKTTLPGNRFVVLITDGQPTYAEGCRGTGRTQDANDPTPIIAEAGNAAQASNIRTFVIGSPGSEELGAPGFADARTWLSKMATSGGTATPGCSDNGPNFCHFDMTQKPDFAQALQDTLKLIVGTVVGCTYQIPPPASGMLAKDKVNVIFTPSSGQASLVPQFGGMGDCTSGWRYSTDGLKIELCPATCDLVQKDAKPQVDVIFGCATQIQITR